jgi:hypothetical protein
MIQLCADPTAHAIKNSEAPVRRENAFQDFVFWTISSLTSSPHLPIYNHMTHY